MKQDIILSFCIPTYNRANRVYECINNILNYKGNQIEVIVSDNHSSDLTETNLRKISDNRFSYYKNDSNLGPAKNLIKVLEKAKGKYVFLLSDEDFVNINILSKIINILKSNEDLSILTGSLKWKKSNRYYKKFNTSFYNKGSQALLSFAFTKSYFSGSIYNKEFIDFNTLWKNLNLCLHYPHLYLEVLLCLKGNVKTMSDTICFIGEPEKEDNSDIINGHSYYDFESRLLQYENFIKLIQKLNIDFETKKNLYKSLSLKLFKLVNSLYKLQNKQSKEMVTLLTKAKSLASENIVNISEEKKVSLELKNYIRNIFIMFVAPYSKT